MDYLLKWIGVDINTLTERRKKQLEKQSVIDEKLRFLHCQEKVAKYLLLQREQNRKMCKEYNDIGYTDYYNLTVSHLDLVDEELNRVSSLLSAGEFCSKN